MSLLKGVDSSVGLGLGTAAAVTALYSMSLPGLTDIRVSEPHEPNVESSRKAAAVKSIILIGTVYLITRDRYVVIIAGAVMTAVDYAVKHQNGIDPMTQRLDVSTGGGSIAPDMAAPMPTYTDGMDG